MTCLVLFWVGLCRENGEKDVTFKVLYCGICHSDLHMVKNEWGISSYPLVPGYALAYYRRHLNTFNNLKYCDLARTSW